MFTSSRRRGCQPGYPQHRLTARRAARERHHAGWYEDVAHQSSGHSADPRAAGQPPGTLSAHLVKWRAPCNLQPPSGRCHRTRVPVSLDPPRTLTAAALATEPRGSPGPAAAAAPSPVVCPRGRTGGHTSQRSPEGPRMGSDRRKQGAEGTSLTPFLHTVQSPKEARVRTLETG